MKLKWDTRSEWWLSAILALVVILTGTLIPLLSGHTLDIGILQISAEFTLLDGLELTYLTRH